MLHKIAETFTPAVIGTSCVIGANVVIYAQTTLGNHVLLGDGVAIREGCVFGGDSLVAMNCTFNHNVTSGKRSKVMDLSHITADTVIEEDVLVGVGVSSANDNKMRLKGEKVDSTHCIHIRSGN